jgi:hypothetical protein
MCQKNVIIIIIIILLAFFFFSVVAYPGQEQEGVLETFLKKNNMYIYVFGVAGDQ